MLPLVLSDMLQVLKRRRKDGSSLIKVDQLRDGVILFEDVADAERYSNYLEADDGSAVSLSTNVLCNLTEFDLASNVNTQTLYSLDLHALCVCFTVQLVTASCLLLQVMIAQCDAHDLVRNVQEVRGVVVVLRKGSNVPMPHHLAVSLRNKQSFEID